ncbi:MAG: hypothetical protein EOM20_17705 [Spartobacteria bacterium]|nr:hypothetical protein [Spartobacteria bacterium]
MCMVRLDILAVVLAQTLLLSAGPTAAGVVIGVPVHTFPFVLYDECDATGIIPYAPTGWMGYAAGIERDDCCEFEPYAGRTCIKIHCARSRKWYGIVWQDPPGDWGDTPGGWDLRKARKLTFWAKGAVGGERIEFGFGVLGKDKDYPDSIKGKTKVFELTPEWTQYTIFAGGDRRCIKTGFSWSARGQETDFTFYLDNIQYED